MSLHRYIVPPPLVLAVHPAPAPVPKSRIDEKSKDKVKADEKLKGGDNAKLDPDHKDAADEKDPKADPVGRDSKNKAEVAPKVKKAPDTPTDSPAGSSSPESPLSPASNVPEPPTPGVDAPKSPEAIPGPKESKKKKRKGNAAAKAAEADKKALPNGDTPAVSSSPPEGEKSKNASEEAKVEEPSEPLPPIRLLCPAPPRPLRTRLDLDPARPYPPINIDPRGAYHKYAKGVQGEVIFIDVTKDGWLVEQWREKPEREALERLTGEADRRRQREVDARLKEKVIRPVPPSAEGLIKELWNDLVAAPSNEIAVDDFWARYDWSDSVTELHTQVASEEMKKSWVEQRAAIAKAKEEKADKAKKEREAAKAAEKAAKESTSGEAQKEGASEVKVIDKAVEAPKIEEKKDDIPPDVSTLPAVERGYAAEVEWTKEGIESILATVGIQCAYNTAKPISRHWANPSGAYLLLSHGHFLLRVEQDIQFKSETAANDFEVLVTSGHDRVFGEMVKAQQAEERKKKEKEYRERKEREKREAAKRAETKPQVPNDEEKEKSGKEPKEIDADGKRDGSMTPVSNVKHIDGEPIKPVENGPGNIAAPKDHEEVVAVVAVPVVEEGKKQTLDEKHEADPKVVGPVGVDVAPPIADPTEHGVKAEKEGKDAPEDKDIKGKVEKPKADKPKVPAKQRVAIDPRDMELLIRLIGPEVADLPMSELKMAMAAVEAAAAASSNKDAALTKKDGGPVIWTWNEPCEKWRWKNYAAGCAIMEEGCWEERDWKVFPDDAGCDEYDAGEQWMERLEEGIYDWSC